jgi:hypothetical protein
MKIVNLYLLFGSMYCQTGVPELSDLTLTCLTTFASTYRCGTGFSSMTIVKTKNRNHLNASSSLQIALSDIEPHIDLLVKITQARVTLVWLV